MHENAGSGNQFLPQEQASIRDNEDPSAQFATKSDHLDLIELQSIHTEDPLSCDIGAPE